jgi:hypothetical protein
MRNPTFILALLVSLVMTSLALADSTGAPPATSIDGVIGVTPVGENTCLAVWIPVAQGKALSGLRWYNNDGSVVFPQLLLASDAGEGPGSLKAATAVADSVRGASSTWSEVTFIEPVRSASAGLFAILQLPVGSERQHLGTGGGAGIGYHAGEGLAAWVSLDGEDWVALDSQLSLAITPLFTDAALGKTMLSKPMAAPAPEVAPLNTALLPARPNPFNPKTEISFTLRQTGGVRLAIYNLRGQRVRQLLDETCATGTHRLEWAGTDDNGRAMPGGVYLVRMQADGSNLSQRLLLVK